MAVLLFAVTILAISGHSCGNWCVCKDGSDAALQRTLDYACGAGADCNPIHLNGPCFQPNTVKAHCSYAVNSFFQKKAQGQGSCDFAGTATVTTTDPSYTGCAFPSSFRYASQVIDYDNHLGNKSLSENREKLRNYEYLLFKGIFWRSIWNLNRL